MMHQVPNPQAAPPKEVAAKANNLYGRDKIAPRAINLDLYYVHSKPRLKKPEPMGIEAVRLDQEGIERVLYARLQGYQGRIFPVLGSLLRTGVFVVLYPVYFSKMLFEHTMQFLKRIIALIVKKLKPPYQYCYRHIKRIYYKLNSIYLSCRKWLNKKTKHVGELVQNLKTWLRVLFRYANRVLEDWALEVKNRFSTKSTTSK